MVQRLNLACCLVFGRCCAERLTLPLIPSLPWHSPSRCSPYVGLRIVHNRPQPALAQSRAALSWANRLLLHVQVEVGAVRWLSPPGVSGLMPVASLGPVRVGPGPVESSSASVEEVMLGLDAWRSIVQREVVVTLALRGVQVGAGGNRGDCASMGYLGYGACCIGGFWCELRGVSGVMQGELQQAHMQQGDIEGTVRWQALNMLKCPMRFILQSAYWASQS